MKKKIKKAKKKTLLEQKNERIKELEQQVKEHRTDATASHKDVLRLEAEQSVIALLLNIEAEQEEVYHGFNRPTRQAKTLHERMVQALVRLKMAYAREDEGSGLEAEKVANLMEVIGIILDDPTRKMEVSRKMFIAKGVAEGKIDPRYLHEHVVNEQHREPNF